MTASSIGRLRAAFTQDLTPPRSNPRLTSPCLLCTHHIRPPIRHLPRRHASTTTNPPTQNPTPRKEFLRPQTHYDLFPQTLPLGPPPTGPFHINPRALRAEFLHLQSLAHPDRHAGAAKPRAEAASARINDAYKTLLDPLLRAQYVLGLAGVDVGDETAGVEDAGLLGEVLEVRERIEGAGGREEIEGLRVENEGRVGECVGRLGGLLEGGEWEEARREAVRLRYWVNVRESLEGWEGGGEGEVGR